MVYHTIHDKLRETVQEILEPEAPTLPKFPIFSLMTVVLTVVVAVWQAPRHASSAFWIGGLSLNAAVGAGLLAFAPWLPERMPDIAIGLLQEPIDAGMGNWIGGYSLETARDELRRRSEGKRSLMTVRMVTPGLLILLGSLTAFPLMIWLSFSAKVGVMTGLIAITVVVLVNLSMALVGLGIWPMLWQLHRVATVLHKSVEHCELCSPKLGPGAP